MKPGCNILMTVYLRVSCKVLYGPVLVLFSCMGMIAMAQASPFVSYPWLDAKDPCYPAWQERLLRQGLASDWSDEKDCRKAADLWWVIEVRPVDGFLYYNEPIYIDEDSGGIVFEFEPELIEKINELAVPVYSGPPKWMPDSLIYWDVYLGDWGYLRNYTRKDIYREMAEPELLMLWVRYEPGGRGWILDASFDYGRFMDLFDMAQLRLDGLATKYLQDFRLE